MFLTLQSNGWSLGRGLVNWGLGYVGGAMVPEAIFEKLEPMIHPHQTILPVSSACMLS